MKRILYIFVIILLSFAFEKNVVATTNVDKNNGIILDVSGNAEQETETNGKMITSKEYYYEMLSNGGTTENAVGGNEENIDPSNCGVLGGFKEDLQNILKAIRIVAPVLVVFLSAYEYLTVVFMKSADDLKKANKRLINRLILIALLFFLPTLLNLILSLIETGDYTTCIN